MKLSIKPYLPRSLMGRSLLILITPVLLIQLFSTFMFFDRHWNRLADRLANGVAGEIGIIADRVAQIGPLNEEGIRPLVYATQKRLQLLVSYKEGDMIARKPYSGIGVGRRDFIYRTLTKALQEHLDYDFTVNVDGREKWTEVAIQFPEGVLYVSAPERRLFSSSSYIFVLWMVGSSVVLLAIAIIFMRNQIRPIRRLAVAAERLGRGDDMFPRFKPEGAYEIRQAGQAFIDMSDSIKRQIEQRAAMLAGISHDLRTPLTRMKLEISMLGDEQVTQALQNDIHDMERMISAYLDFARDSGGEEAERVNIGQILSDFSENIRREGLMAHTQIEGDVIVRVRPLAFLRCLNNLAGNARKYGAKNLWVYAHKDDRHLIVHMDDDGPGIQEDKIGEVFKPFYRIDPSRNQETGGVGLGLSIVQDIIHRHGGQVSLCNREQGGLRVTIMLPL